MSETMELVQTAVLALVAGVALPALVQLFLTLRSLQRSSVAAERKLDEALREITAVVSAGRRPPDALGAVIAVLAPAVVAAVRAARAEHAAPATNGAPEPNA